MDRPYAAMMDPAEVAVFLCGTGSIAGVGDDEWHTYDVIGGKTKSPERLKSIDPQKTYFQPEPLPCGLDVQKVSADTSARARTMLRILETPAVRDVRREFLETKLHELCKKYTAGQTVKYEIAIDRDDPKPAPDVSTVVMDHAETPIPESPDYLNTVRSDATAMAVSVDGPNEGKAGSIRASVYLRPSIELASLEVLFCRTATKVLSKFIADDAKSLFELSTGGTTACGPREMVTPYLSWPDISKYDDRFHDNASDDQWLASKNIDLTLL